MNFPHEPLLLSSQEKRKQKLFYKNKKKIRIFVLFTKILKVRTTNHNSKLKN